MWLTNGGTSNLVLVLGIEVGRVNVAVRACGVAQRAFELAIAYAQQRHAFGKPIARHQAIEFKLAEMGTKTVAAHQMMVMAARAKIQKVIIGRRLLEKYRVAGA